MIINSGHKRLFSRVEGEDASWKLLATCRHRRSKAPGRWCDCSGLDHRSQGITPVHAPMMVFVPEGTVVGTGDHFAKISIFFYNTLLADQLGSFGMAAGFDKLSTKQNQKFKNTPNIQK